MEQLGEEGSSGRRQVQGKEIAGCLGTAGLLKDLPRPGIRTFSSLAERCEDFGGEI